MCSPNPSAGNIASVFLQFSASPNFCELPTNDSHQSPSETALATWFTAQLVKSQKSPSITSSCSSHSSRPMPNVEVETPSTWTESGHTLQSPCRIPWSPGLHLKSHLCPASPISALLYLPLEKRHLNRLPTLRCLFPEKNQTSRPYSQ